MSIPNITFTGLFSGISTDEIIEALVGLRRTPITQLENLAERQGFEKTAYQAVNTKILSLKTTLLSLRLESTFLTKLAESSSPGLLGAQAGFNAQPASHSVTIQSIARGARAVSGLDNRALERAAAKMAFGNTAGIATIAMTANNLGETRALEDTVLHDTTQAGVGSARVTAGDTIKIDVTLKDGSTNTEYFTFSGDATDTVEALRQAIHTAFQGEAQVAVDSNGAFLITETDPSGVNTISLDGLTFIDEDYSGSTFDISVGNTTAGNVATSRLIAGTRTFTTGNSANIANGTETLISLDQFSGGALSGDETIEILGTQYDGDDIEDSFAIDATTTLNDLIAHLQTLYNDAPDPPYETTVTLENGKIMFRDQATGSSETSVTLYFDDPDGTLNLNTGTFVMVDQGSNDISQTIRTSAMTVGAEGKHLVNGTEGRGGVVTGTVSLDADTILGSLGVTETALFTIDRDDGSGVVDPVSVFGITDRSTVQDLIDAINAQVPGVTAQLVDDGGGSYNLQILASKGGVDIRLTDDALGNGILDNVIDPDPLSIDSDISTLNDSGLSSVESATTDTSDYTFTTIFTPANGGPVQRRTVVGSDGDDITDLIPNVQLQGAGGAFQEGVALIYTNQSSELNVGPATSGYIFGLSDISDGSNTTTPPVNIYTYIENSGLDVDVTSGTFTINGVTITIDNPETQTMDEIMGMVNSSGAGVLMEYDSVNDRFMIYRPDAGNTTPISLGGAGDTSNFFTALGLFTAQGGVQFTGTTEGSVNTTSALAYSGLTIPVVSGTFTINGVKITVNTGADSLEDIIDRINESPAGVIASYDSIQDRLVLTQDLDEPPYFDRFQIGSATDTSNFWTAMRLTETYQTSQNIGSTRVKAQFTVDGQSYTRDTNTVEDVINDVTLTLRGVSSDPIALDITSDTSRTTDAITDFVVAYNELTELLDVQPLTDEERANLAELTDSERANMTFTEIDDYEHQREELWQQEILFTSTTLNRMDSSLRLNLLTPVTSITGGSISTLSDLGITTGNVGLGIQAARTAYLVDDSTDPDVIREKLEENLTLQNLLESDPESVMDLFANDEESTAEVTGNIDITYGITLAAPLSFSVGNGTTQATVTLGIGFHSSSQIRSEITNALIQVGLGDTIRVYQTDGGFLQLESTTDTGRARISIQDLGAGSGLANVLGIPSQTASGTDASANAGLSRRLDTFLDGYTGTSGVVTEKIKLGGLIDQELLRIADRIDDYEYRLDLYEARLRRQFAQMEVVLADYQSTSQLIQAYLNAAQDTSSSSNQGISLTM
jgi:flagellar capping protein FliD